MESVQRGYVRTQLTKLHAAKTKIPTNSIDENKFIKTKVDDYKTKLDNYNDTIIKDLFIAQTVDDSAVNNELANSEKYADIIIKLNIALESALRNQSSGHTHSSNNDRDHKARLRGPNVVLPKYSASESESLEKFLYAFETALEKYELSSFEK